MKEMKLAFTMAEILLSLTIIGVVAAITLPSLTGNINERTWNTQRKALYARFSQAIALMPALNGYGTLTEGDSSTSAVDTAAETFVTDGLAKVLKINNICDADHLADCGIANSVTNLAGSTITPFPATMGALNSTFLAPVPAGHVGSNYSQIDTKAVAFETQNGESIAVFYNPNCRNSMNEVQNYYTQPKMCANFVYDLNGNKGPNTVGKDIGFISVLYPSDSVVVAPMPLPRSVNNVMQVDGAKECRKMDSDSRMPNKEELAAMYYNNLFVGLGGSCYWSGTVYSAGSAWHLCPAIGYLGLYGKLDTYSIRCIKR